MPQSANPAEVLAQAEVQAMRDALDAAQQLGRIITRTQSLFVGDSDRKTVFAQLLDDLLALTRSEYGFVGEVLRTADGSPYLKTYAITDISWDPGSRTFFERNIDDGLEFHNLDTLFGAVMTSGRAVIANDPERDPRRGGTPPGHPPLRAFLGVPVAHAGELVGMIGLANRPGGYDDAVVDFLAPVVSTLAHLTAATRARRDFEAAQTELARLSRVASETTNGVVITDATGRVEWVNAGFTRLAGFSLEEMRGRKPGEVLQGRGTDPQTVARMRAAIARAEPFDVEVLNYHKSGEAYWLRVNCNPLRDRGGALQGFIAIQSDVSREKADETTIRESERRLAAVIDGGRIGTWEWDVPGGGATFNALWAEMLGYTLEELAPTSFQTWVNMVHPDDLAVAKECLSLHFSGRSDRYDVKLRMRHKLGRWVWVNARGHVTRRAEDGTPLVMLGTHIDITDLEEANRALGEQAKYTQAVIDNIIDGIVIADCHGVILSFNPAAERIFGYRSAEVEGCNLSMLMPEPTRTQHDGFLSAYQSDGESRVVGAERELQGLRKDGTLFPVELAISEIERDGQRVFVGLIRDITERKRAEREIESLAFYDPLTRLPNRRLFMDRLRHALVASRRSGLYGAVLFLDLDNFKSLNDVAGHAVGDRLLERVATRLLSCVRDGDTVARLGGDEFVVLLENLAESAEDSACQVEIVVERIRTALGQDFDLGERIFKTGSSIGITLFPGASLEIDELLKRADLAMYEAKSAGRDTFRFFDPGMQAAVIAHAELEADLRAALSKGEFELFLQKQVAVDGRTIGAEALLRWRHPVRGLVSPAEFIPVVEESGLIVPLGEWVMRRACEMLARWSSMAGLAGLTLAVNISARQLRQADFVEQVLAALQASGANPRRLKLELTESSVIFDVDAVIAKMSTLRSLGLSFALDDFGTGYSSLSYLKRLPLNQLKIDQNFVRDLLCDPNDAVIARTIVALGASLGLDVIAEGVESEAQRHALQMMGCDHYQGYFFGQPVPLDTFEREAGAPSA
ncbi:MAG: EAL domain-containing protein [Rhodocyclaceae bacterium]